MTLQLPTEFDSTAYPIQLVRGAHNDPYHRRKFVATRDIANDEKLFEELPLLGVSTLAHASSPLAGQFTVAEALSMNFATDLRDCGMCGWIMALTEYVIARHPDWLLEPSWMDQFGTDVANTQFARKIDTECGVRLRPALATANARRSKLSNKKTYAVARRFVRLVCNNSFSVENDITSKQMGEALYHWCSFFNHSCAANARWRVGMKQKITIYANAPIAAGTEITISYGCDDTLYEPGVQAMGLRRFTCQCTMCRRPDNLTRPLPTLATLWQVVNAELASYMPLLNDARVEDLPRVIGGIYAILSDANYCAHIVAHPIETAHIHGYHMRTLVKYHENYRTDMSFVAAMRALHSLMQKAALASDKCALDTTHARRRACELKAGTALMRILSTVYNAVDKDVAEMHKRVMLMQNLFPRMHDAAIEQLVQCHAIGDKEWAGAIVDEALGEFGMGKTPLEQAVN